MRFPSKRRVVLGMAIAAGPLLIVPAGAATAHATSGPAGTAATAFSTLPQSVQPTTDAAIGNFTSAQMSVEVILSPGNALQLSSMLADVYNPNSPNYRHWLGKGEFNARFAPSSAQVAAVASYLRENGLVVGQSVSPFIVRASGSSAAVGAAFKTNLQIYRSSRGSTYFSNASAVALPTALAANVLGVVGLSDTAHARSQVKVALNHGSAAASCEAPYPNRAQLFELYLKNVVPPLGYGGGPGCNGLTPSQDNSLYGAPNLGTRGKGAGVNLALFELSAYKRSDIAKWARTFYGQAYSPRLVDIIVDGGPLSPSCPSKDTCPPELNGYSGDVEVDADIETQLALSPEASHILVYNAPGDETGQTELDEYVQIAGDDLADVVSSSWANCESDVSASYAQAENLIFEQMALQGQSMFSSSGDSGAFCTRLNGATIVDNLDPSAQPWVTSVGGTSFASDNPGMNPKPSYPDGVETVWNPDNLCNLSANEGGQPGLFWCTTGPGAGGGGNSRYWGRPFYQSGPGIANPYTKYGNGTTQCSLVATGTPCRELPDISANADEFTPYAEYCTGSAATPNSSCVFSSGDTPPGWFGIGGTSLSSPLWSAIFADRDSFQGTRSGNANPLLYLLYNVNPHGYFHDITGIGQTTNNNGLFPTTPNYDLATGIGTPKMSAIITGFPQQ